MGRTFTTATDDRLIDLITSAKDRLAVIAPALTTPVAKALASRMLDLPKLSLTVILDADAQVYRMGYGDPEALQIIRKASDERMFDLREQPGVRIGVVIADERTMVYAPVSRNVEAGSTTTDKPNAIVVSGGTTDRLAEAIGVHDSVQEVGKREMEPRRVAKMEEDLAANPPQPFDLTRRLTVFMSEVQFIELRIRNATFSSRKIKLPQEFQKFEDQELRRRVDSNLKIPIDLHERVDVRFKSYRGEETVTVNEATIKRERDHIERAFFHDWKGRGKVILRTDKDQLRNELNRLLAMTEKYHGALKERFQQHKRAFRERFVKEFVGLFMHSPPQLLARRCQSDEASCRKYIETTADRLFDNAVALGTPQYDVVYKDISIEDLKDEQLMDGLRDLMERAHVDPLIVRRLFHTEHAYAAKRAYPQD